MKVIGVIAARYQSTRFPGKVLADICGHPMVWWVCNRVRAVKGLDEIYVATDDERIRKVCSDYQFPVVMTASTHRAAADRLQEVSETIQADFYVQINGDEPLIQPEAIAAAIPSEIPQDYEFGTHVITELTDPAQALDPSNIKVVFDNNMNTLYMSRTPIPYPFKAIDFQYYKHVGVIGYNKKMLDFYKNSKPGRLESIEGIDPLRFLDYGKQFKLAVVHNCHSLSVDTEKDLKMVIKMIQEKGITE